MNRQLLSTIFLIGINQTCFADFGGEKFRPNFPVKFPSVSVAANVSKDSEEDLKRKGYINIGNIKYILVTKTCIKKSTSIQNKNTGKNVHRVLKDKCKSKGGNYSKNTTFYLLQAAAEKGGHLVTLKSSNVSENQVDDRTYCAAFAKYTGECIGGGLVSTRRHYIYSEGVVWRKDDTGVSNIELIKQGRYDRVKKLLETGKLDLHKPDAKLNYPLFYALKYGHLNITQLFLQKGARLKNTNNNRKNKFEYRIPALAVAIQGGNPDIVQLLIKRGVNVNQKIYQKNYPLSEAIYRSGWVIRDKEKDASLTESIFLQRKANYLKIVEMLVKAGAKLEKRGKGISHDKILPLMAATENLDTDMVKLLLKLGADPQHRTRWMSFGHYSYSGKKNVTALDWARHLVNKYKRSSEGADPGSAYKAKERQKMVTSQKIVSILEKVTMK